jgi:hypothetical protein
MMRLRWRKPKVEPVAEEMPGADWPVSLDHLARVWDQRWGSLNERVCALEADAKERAGRVG